MGRLAVKKTAVCPTHHRDGQNDEGGGGEGSNKKKIIFFFIIIILKSASIPGRKKKNLDVDVLAHPCDVRGSAVYL
jgi:hypothetical protein